MSHFPISTDSKFKQSVVSALNLRFYNSLVILLSFVFCIAGMSQAYASDYKLSGSKVVSASDGDTVTFLSDQITLTYNVLSDTTLGVVDFGSKDSTYVISSSNNSVLIFGGNVLNAENATFVVNSPINLTLGGGVNAANGGLTSGVFKLKNITGSINTGLFSVDGGIPLIGYSGGNGANLGGGGGGYAQNGGHAGSAIIDSIILDSAIALTSGNGANGSGYAGGGGAGFAGGGGGSAGGPGSNGGNGGWLYVNNLTLTNAQSITSGKPGIGFWGAGGGSDFAGGAGGYLNNTSAGGVNGGNGGMLVVNVLNMSNPKYLTNGKGGSNSKGWAASDGGSGFSGGSGGGDSPFGNGGNGGLLSIKLFNLGQGSNSAVNTNITGENAGGYSGTNKFGGGGGSIEIGTLAFVGANDISLSVTQGLDATGDVTNYSTSPGLGGNGGTHVTPIAQGGHAYIGNLKFNPDSKTDGSLPLFTFSTPLVLQGSYTAPVLSSSDSIDVSNVKYDNHARIDVLSDSKVDFGDNVTAPNGTITLGNIPQVNTVGGTYTPASLNVVGGNLNFTGDRADIVAVVNPDVVGTPSIVMQGGVLDFTKVQSLNISIEGASFLPEIGKQYQYQLFTGAKDAIHLPAKVLFSNNDKNSLLKWSYDPLTSTIVSSVDFSNLPSDDPISQAIIDSYHAGNTKARELVSHIGLTGDVSSAVAKVTPVDATAIAIVEATDLNHSSVSDRISTFSFGTNEDHDKKVGGVNSGDDISSKAHGAWVQHSYYKAKQKSSGKIGGYKTISDNSILGYDTMLSEDNTVGLAYSRVNSKFNERDRRLGNSGKSVMNVVSIYGMYDMPYAGNTFATYILSHGFGKVKMKQQKFITRNVIALGTGKYNAKTYSANVTLNKKYMLKEDKVTLMPSAGMRYTKFIDSAYTESGADIQSFSVAKKDSYLVEGVLGAVLSYAIERENSDVKITPSVFGKTYLKIKDKTPKTRVYNEALLGNVDVKGASRSSAWYQFGSKVNIAKNWIDCDLSYELSLDKKYVGHQGAIRFGISF